MEKMIQDAINYVEKFFAEDYSGHDFWHTMRVFQLAKSIADKEECEQEIVYLSALLHDVDDYKIVGPNAVPFQNAKAFLNKEQYPEEKIEQICHIISQVSFKGKSIKPDTIEGKIVQDADRLDALGAMGIARTFAYGGSHHTPMHDPNVQIVEDVTPEEYYNTKRTTINHFYEKLLKLKDYMNTETAKKMAEHRHEFIERFLEEFYAEWDGKR